MKLDRWEVEELRALLRLRREDGLGDRGIHRAVAAAGSAVGALQRRGCQRSLLPAGKGDGPEPELDRWIGDAMGVIPLTSPRYPQALKNLTDPPPVLFYRGKWKLLEPPCVAVVGSRRSTEAARRASESMGRALAAAGFSVVSGMALGIDGAAHRGALRAGGRTVAVLGSGFERVYPSAHRRLSSDIGKEGLLLSEFLPEESARPHHFPRRNRIIAALSRAVIVVEAGRRSGALITADHALDLGREVMAVPGSVENPQATGSNALLRDGASAVVDPALVVEDLKRLGLHPPAEGGEGAPGTELEGEGAMGGVPDGLAPLLEVLTSQPLSVDEVASRASVPVETALAGLAALELGGWAHQCPGMRYRR